MAQQLILNPGQNIKPEFTIDEAKAFLNEIFGLHCLKIEELNGYDDKNYKVEVGTECNNQFIMGKVYSNGCVLKIMNSFDSNDLEFVLGYNALLQFLGECFIILK